MAGVTIELCGGLGNQLFQIATAYAYSLKYNIPLFIDKEDKYGKRGSYWHSIYKKLNDIVSKKPKNIKYLEYSEDKNFIPKPLPFPQDNKVTKLNGYYQSSTYFNDYRQRILDLFSCKEKDMLKYRPGKNSCCIHIRRGDYLDLQQYHPVQTPEYYEEAIKIMKSKTEISEWYIVSEDIQWAKEQKVFEGLNAIFLSQSVELDFWTMAECQHFIMANSTFVWWAWYLSTYSEKIVVAPKRWFGIGPSFISLYEPGWIII